MDLSSATVHRVPFPLFGYRVISSYRRDLKLGVLGRRTTEADATPRRELLAGYGRRRRQLDVSRLAASSWIQRVISTSIQALAAPTLTGLGNLPALISS